MSWSVAAVGKAGAVRKAIAEQFQNGGRCMEPEESIRLEAAATMDQALAAQDPNTIIKAAASGSQGYKDFTAKSGVFNTMSMSIEVMHGFVE